MDKVVHTSRLVLRPMKLPPTEADIAGCHSIWSDPLVGKWFPSGPSKDLEETSKRFCRILTPPTLTAEDQALLGLSEPAAVHYACLLRKEGDPELEQIGVLALATIASAEHQVYRPYNLAYNFRSSSWGKGYATEALRAFMEALPEELRTKAVAIIESRNERSLKLVERVGFEETKRQSLPSWTPGEADVEAVSFMWKK
ncbi:hypothetical protein BT69DRAFT_1347938 [Atractiella rhizophila]|nr:hypothetical protein BT69DRAFT_1358495 [Atractiella rhizophila]KAH8926608.1 hypothetical protein BT69DRAFT_1347938 [Atractiella rhizophila]